MHDFLPDFVPLYHDDVSDEDLSEDIAESENEDSSSDEVTDQSSEPADSDVTPESIPLYDDDVSDEDPGDDASGSETECLSDDDATKQSTEQTDGESDEEVHTPASEDEVCFDKEIEQGSDQEEDQDDDCDEDDECFEGPVYAGPTTPPMGKEVHPNMLLRQTSFKQAAASESRNEFFGRAEGPGELFVRGDRSRETRLSTYHEGFYEVYWAGNQRHWRKRRGSTVVTANPTQVEDSGSGDDDLPASSDLTRRDRSRSPLSRAVFEKDTERSYEGPVDEGTRLLASARKRPAWSGRTIQTRTPHKRRRTGESTSDSHDARLVFPNMPSTPVQKRQRRVTEDMTQTPEYQEWLRKFEEMERADLQAIYKTACASLVELGPKVVKSTTDCVFEMGEDCNLRFKPFC